VPSRTPVAGASCWTAAFTKISPDPTILPSSVLSKRVDDATVTKAADTTRLSDFNRDGITDLVVRDAAGKDAKLWLYPGDGTGGVAARTPISGGWPPVTALATPGNLEVPAGTTWSSGIQRAACGSTRATTTAASVRHVRSLVSGKT
jgi:hypothetical protein